MGRIDGAAELGDFLPDDLVVDEWLIEGVSRDGVKVAIFSADTSHTKTGTCEPESFVVEVWVSIDVKIRYVYISGPFHIPRPTLTGRMEAGGTYST